MRVIAGTLGGRIFASPHGHRTHPMSDKMRGAMFNMLGNLEGLRVLDAFAGTGALSFEAVSRGAAMAVAIERDRRAQRTIAENIEALGIEDSVRLIRARAQAWLSTTTDMFDIVLLDPPYDAIHMDVIKNLAARMDEDGVIVLSWPGSEEAPMLPNRTCIRSKHYGDGSLHIYV